MSARDYGLILVGISLAMIPSLVMLAFLLFRRLDFHLREEEETPRTLDELDRIIERVSVEMRRPT